MLPVEFILRPPSYICYNLRTLSGSILFTVARLPLSEADLYQLNGGNLTSALQGFTRIILLSFMEDNWLRTNRSFLAPFSDINFVEHCATLPRIYGDEQHTE